MTSLTLIIGAVVLFWALAYIGAPLIVAAVATTVLAAVALFVAKATVVGIIFAIFAGIMLFLSMVPLRRALVTKPIFKAFKKVLPPMTSTEREALEAGDVWWEGEMFRGKPDWNKLLNVYQRTKLTDEEQSFIDNETQQLCDMINDFQINVHDRDMPAEVWTFIREKGFISMLISKEWGGKGFSAYAQSCIVTKIATRSIAAAVTVMVPNSLGPGELLLHYGTDAQKKEWLPGLASGKYIPCFGLTGPEAGSDAGAIPDAGIVTKGMHNGEEVIGLNLNFSKRYITLAPVSNCVGLAFKMYDPDGLLGDQKELGITVALLPGDHPGIDIGDRHFPLGSAFMNGPIYGTNVFIPLDWIIGGQEMAGKGWRMLVECLSAGRGISLPALSAAAGKVTYRQTGAYARIRRQFKMPIGKFEGVEEAMGRIGGLAYILEATRTLTASSIDMGAKPSVVTAMAKYHMTEMMRTSLNDSMDIHGGRAIQMGESNYLATAYWGVPVAITVEGANILTRNLMIFGQGAIRCHPHVFPEMEAARDDDIVAFDKEFWGHIGFSINRAMRSFTMGLFGAWLAKSPKSDHTAKYYKQLTRMSSSLAICADMAMGVLGGELKRKERLSARLGDVLSHLYMASCVLKYYHDEGEPESDRPYVEWAMQYHLHAIGNAFEEFFNNFPGRVYRGLLRTLVFPRGKSSAFDAPQDFLDHKISSSMMEPSEMRDRLSFPAYINQDPNDSIGLMETTFAKLIATEDLYNKYYRAAAKGIVDGLSFEERIKQCVDQGILTQAEADQVADYNEARFKALATDTFKKEELQGAAVSPAEDKAA